MGPASRPLSICIGANRARSLFFSLFAALVPLYPFLEVPLQAQLGVLRGAPLAYPFTTRLPWLVPLNGPTCPAALPASRNETTRAGRPTSWRIRRPNNWPNALVCTPTRSVGQ